MLSNDVNQQYATSNSQLRITDISQKPKQGYVYINPDSLKIQYLPKLNVYNVSDTFTYRTCNTANYCSVAQVVVKIVQNGCATGQFQDSLNIASSNPTYTLYPSADDYIDSSNTTKNYGASGSFTIGTSYSSSKYREKRAILKFNLSSISSYGTPTSAYLSIRFSGSNSFTNTSGSNPFPAKIYRLKQDWTEGSGSSSGSSSSGASWKYSNYAGSGTTWKDTVNGTAAITGSSYTKASPAAARAAGAGRRG